MSSVKKPLQRAPRHVGVVRRFMSRRGRVKNLESRAAGTSVGLYQHYVREELKSIGFEQLTRLIQTFTANSTVDEEARQVLLDQYDIDGKTDALLTNIIRYDTRVVDALQKAYEALQEVERLRAVVEEKLQAQTGDDTNEQIVYGTPIRAPGATTVNGLPDDAVLVERESLMDAILNKLGKDPSAYNNDMWITKVGNKITGVFYGNVNKPNASIERLY